MRSDACALADSGAETYALAAEAKDYAVHNPEGLSEAVSYCHTAVLDVLPGLEAERERFAGRRPVGAAEGDWQHLRRACR